MKATFKFLLLVLWVLLFAASPSNAQIKSTYHSERIIVKLKPGVSAQATSSLQNALQAGAVKRFPQIGVEVWHIQNTSVEQVLQQFRKDPRIEYIEPDYTISLETVLPNDPNFSSLWGMHNIGQTGGTPDADIDAPEAWAMQTGGEVLVGVIDTGVDYNHEDLAANMWTNPSEIPNNGVDDDGNGYVDDVHGYDFANRDGDPFDDRGHGTHVAGTIATPGNNGIGVAGVCWTAKIMALKFLDASGSGSTSDAIEAVLYATTMHARVTNNSWGGTQFSQALHDAIAFAGAQGQLFIAAAGNSNSDNDLAPHYPSSYALDNIIAVAATDHNDELASFSCYGAASVDLGAPGVDILSTVPNNAYDFYSGTSMAAPHVTGVVSLLWSTFPGMPTQEVKHRILTFVDRAPSLTGKTVSGGRLNAHKALLAPNLYEIAANVDTIWTSGNAGPLAPLTDAGYVIAAGSEFTASFPSLVMIAARIGPGRVIAFGHEGFFNNDDIIKFDNLQIATNAFGWLDYRQRRKIIFTTGHEERAGEGLTHLHDCLRQLGYTVVLHADSVDENLLIDAGVVFIGNAWGEFDEDEIAALRSFLQRGGSLLLMGLGWSWELYHPGTTLYDYPMNKIGEIAGVRWLDGVISDDVHQHEGAPLFRLFYPEVQIRMVRAENVGSLRGERVDLPLKLAANGDENSLAGGVRFDPSILKEVQASLGRGASAATLETDTSQIGSGYLGLRLNLSAGDHFTPGIHEIITLSFLVDENAPEDSTTRIEFGDQPIARAVTDANGQALSAMWVDGSIEIQLPGCTVTVLQTQLAKHNLTTEAAFDFDGLRKFRDGFLRRYQQGEEYIKMYYAFRKHVKTDPASLLKAAAALPHLYKAVSVLENPSSNAVVVTPELRRAMMAVIESHREVDNIEFQMILARIKNDLNAYQGLAKSKLLAKMHQVNEASTLISPGNKKEIAEEVQIGPNPFNPSTTIRYTLAQAAHVTMKVYNVLGEEVLTLIEEAQAQGQHAVVWQGKNRAGQVASSGMYFLRMSLRTGSGEVHVLTHKMLLMK